jgi:hypothetical protein
VCQRNYQSFNFAINLKNKEIHLQIHSEIQTFGTYFGNLFGIPQMRAFSFPKWGIPNLFVCILPNCTMPNWVQ